MTIQEYNDIYKNSITKSMQIESSGGVTITNTNICSEQMSLEEALCSEENLIIGSCESACFKIRIADMNHNFEGETLTVYQMIMVDEGGDLLLESGDSDYILLENGDRISLEMVGVPVPYGKFKVLSDKPTNDRRWRDLTCYDAMYDILNADVAEWYNSLTFPMTIKNFRDRFFNYLGITQDTVTLVNDNFETQGGFSVSGALSGKDVITSICELNGVFGHISRDGLFEYISLPSANSLALDWYIDGTGAYEDYLVQKITGIVARSSEDDVGTTVGTDTNLYVVEDNPLIYGSEGTASLTTALTNLLNNVKDINYRPFNVDTYGNPMLPLGTNLTITTRNQTINSFLMTRVLSGIQSLKDSISAKGEKYRPTEVNSLRSETKRTKGIIHELINDVDELRSTIIDLDNQTSSEIQQLSNEIVLKVDASGNIVKVALASNASEGSTFAVNADNIRFTAGSVMRFDANNIIINSTYFKVDQYGNLECTSGKIGNWTIRTSGLSYGMTADNDYAHDGIFLSSSAMEVIVNYHNYNTHNEINRAGFFIKNHSGNTDVNIVAIGSANSGTLGDITCRSTSGNHYTNMSGINFIADANNGIGNVGFYTRNNNGNREMARYFIDSNFTEFKVVCTNGAKGLVTSSVSNTELGYLSGVTSNIQTQLNGKQATITGGATTIVSDNLTANKALVSNANGKVAVSSVTATELGYLSGATSNIQGQIDGLGAKSVSGNPVVITDAEAMSADEVIVTLTPKQDLHGYANPWAGGAGTNIMPPGEAKTETLNGITFTSDGNGRYTIKGTSTAVTECFFNCDEYVGPDMYNTTIAFCNSVGVSSNCQFYFYNNNNRVSTWDLNPANRTYTGLSGISGNTINKYGIYVKSGVTVDMTLSPMLISGDVTSNVPPFTPYENICPISGLTQSTVDRCGKNLFNSDAPRNSTFTNDYATIIANYFNNGYYAAGYPTGDVGNIVNNNSYETAVIPVKSGLTYTIKAFSGSNFSKALFLDANYNIVSASSGWTTLWTHTALQNEKYLLIGASNGNPNLQVEVGSEATALAVSNYKRVTIQFGQTIYGGTVDYNTGVVSCEWQHYSLTTSDVDNILGYQPSSGYKALLCDLSALSLPPNKSSLPSELLYNTFETVNSGYNQKFGTASIYAGSQKVYFWANDLDGSTSAKTALKNIINDSGVEFAYKLATPITIQLSPKHIELLLNNNTLTTNCDSLNITYQTNSGVGDTASALDKRVASLEDKTVYSTTEKIVGEWIDGKPIYEITMIPPSGTGSANTWIDLGTVGLGANTVDSVIKLFGAYTYQSEYFSCPNQRSMLDYVKTSDKMYYYNTGTNPTYPYFVTMQYTKA